MSSHLKRHIGSISGDSARFYLRINVYGLGLLAMWTAVDTLLLPDRVSATVASGIQGSALGLSSTLGVGMALVVQPVAGRLSDAWHGRDKRRPFIIAGTVLVIPGLALFGRAPTFVVVLISFVVMQLATNISQVAFQAYIPDLVEEQDRGIASGFKNFLSILGAAVGLLGAQGMLSVTGSTWPPVAFLAVLLGIVGWLTLTWQPRIAGSPSSSMREAVDPRPMFRDFRQSLRDHVTLRLAIVAQFLFMLGIYPAQRFLLLFLRDRFNNDAGPIAAIGGVAAIFLAVLAAVVAGVVSDAIGRKPVLMVCAISSGTGLALIGCATTIPIAALAGGLIAIGLGAFQSVNWALMSDDLPEGQAAATLGIANVATAGAGTAAGLFGPIVDVVNALVPSGTYQVLFGLAAIVALSSLIPMRRIDASPEPGRASA